MGKKQFEFMGDNHIATAIETPMRDDAFNKSDDEKIHTIQHYFENIRLGFNRR